MKHNYSIKTFTPSEAALSIIRQFAYTYRTLQTGNARVALYLN